MKKILISTLVLTHAIAIHSMDNGLKSLNKAPNNRIITRTALTRDPHAQDAAVSKQSADKDLKKITSRLTAPQMTRTAGALRQHVNPHNSWTRISVADPYPADSEDTWDIVTKHDAKDAAVMETAQNVLLEAKNLVPEDLKSYVKTNIHESKNPLKDLETARELIWACMTRTAPTFASDYVETLTKNFDPCKKYKPDFDYSKVYDYLRYDNDFAMQEPNETFAQLIKHNLDIAVTEDDEETQWFMRQFGFIFRDPATQQTYNAYLKGGHDALKALMIPAEQQDALQACFDRIADAKYVLKELQKEQK